MRNNRRIQASELRYDLADRAFAEVHPDHVSNGEENLYATKVASYSKGLPHSCDQANFGEVEPAAYASLTRALCSGKAADFEAIIPGVDAPDKWRKLTSPQAGLAFDLEGLDAQAVTLAPPPRLDSPEATSEMVELYWMALCRDVDFGDYSSNTDIAAAVAELNELPGFESLRPFTPDTLFRGFTPGDRRGPYLSQFLLHDARFGTLTISQRQQTKRPDTDYVTDINDWLDVQNGEVREPNPTQDLDPERRHLRNLRDLSHYVHFDALYEAYLNACLILLDMGAPIDPGNPYNWYGKQAPFATFGGPHVLSLVTEVATRALKAVWYQKWFVHRRLRPEAYGGLIHLEKHNPGRYPFIPTQMRDAPVLPRVKDRWRSFLLPQAFPEGSPTHPAYGAGHATVAGACVTVLKAWFEESWPAFHRRHPGVRQAVVAGADGTTLSAYAGDETLTVGDELNKLASNIALGRNGAGVHWRSDYTRSVELGEQIAISILREQLDTYNEDHSLHLTKFNGQTITLG